MRLLTVLMLVLAAVWGGYWFVGSRALDQGARGWFAAEAAAGRGARYQELSVAGFPNRFDLTITEPHLESPDRALAWDAPFAQILALSYKPWHVIAALPNQQTLTLQNEIIALTSTKMQASVVVSPTPAAALDRLALVVTDLAAQSDAGWRVAAKGMDFATDRQADDANAHKIGLRITDLVPDADMMATMLGGGDLPPVVELIYADAIVTLTAPLDRFATQTNPQFSQIDLTRVQITWGAFDLTGTGRVIAGADGLAEGRIEWTLRNWRMVPPLLASSGVVEPEIAPTILRMLEIMAAGSPDPEVLAVPLVFQSGRMSLGPLPLGPAPKLN